MAHVSEMQQSVSVAVTIPPETPIPLGASLSSAIRAIQATQAGYTRTIQQQEQHLTNAMQAPQELKGMIAQMQQKRDSARQAEATATGTGTGTVLGAAATTFSGGNFHQSAAEGGYPFVGTAVVAEAAEAAAGQFAPAEPAAAREFEVIYESGNDVLIRDCKAMERLAEAATAEALDVSSFSSNFLGSSSSSSSTSLGPSSAVAPACADATSDATTSPRKRSVEEIPNKSSDEVGIKKRSREDLEIAGRCRQLVTQVASSDSSTPQGLGLDVFRSMWALFPHNTAEADLISKGTFDSFKQACQEHSREFGDCKIHAVFHRTDEKNIHSIRKLGLLAADGETIPIAHGQKLGNAVYTSSDFYKGAKYGAKTVLCLGLAGHQEFQNRGTSWQFATSSYRSVVWGGWIIAYYKSEQVLPVAVVDTHDHEAACAAASWIAQWLCALYKSPGAERSTSPPTNPLQQVTRPTRVLLPHVGLVGEQPRRPLLRTGNPGPGGYPALPGLTRASLERASWGTASAAVPLVPALGSRVGPELKWSEDKLVEIGKTMLPAAFIKMRRSLQDLASDLGGCPNFPDGPLTVSIAGKLSRAEASAYSPFEFALLTVEGFGRLQQMRQVIKPLNNGRFFDKNPATKLLERYCGFTMHAERQDPAVVFDRGPEILTAAFEAAKAVDEVNSQLVHWSNDRERFRSESKVYHLFTEVVCRSCNPCLEARVSKLEEFLTELTLPDLGAAGLSVDVVLKEDEQSVEQQIGYHLTNFRQECLNREAARSGFIGSEAKQFADALWKQDRDSKELRDFSQIFNAQAFLSYLKGRGVLAPAGRIECSEAEEVVKSLETLGTFP
eukprot:TRINITY_DN13123_c0_g2_i1.p1 TRINITY_DN13123_c0_g2~~TRINITY_DN13123_c0_g2_i1.p1  ORF type:complete len:839 (-),score=156.34 TRINITY_DN13123_c0_g2_i1:199-2715(-)